jgi:hypothetical protein
MLHVWEFAFVIFDNLIYDWANSIRVTVYTTSNSWKRRPCSYRRVHLRHTSGRALTLYSWRNVPIFTPTNTTSSYSIYSIIESCEMVSIYELRNHIGSTGGRNSSAGRVKNFLHVVQTGSGVHPTTYPVGTEGYFPGGKAAGTWSWPFTSS